MQLILASPVRNTYGKVLIWQDLKVLRLKLLVIILMMIRASSYLEYWQLSANFSLLQFYLLSSLVSSRKFSSSRGSYSIWRVTPLVCRLQVLWIGPGPDSPWPGCPGYILHRHIQWTVIEDTVPTNVYMSNYLSHCTVQYGSHSSEVTQSIHSVVPTASRTVARM